MLFFHVAIWNLLENELEFFSWIQPKTDPSTKTEGRRPRRPGSFATRVKNACFMRSLLRWSFCVVFPRNDVPMFRTSGSSCRSTKKQSLMILAMLLCVYRRMSSLSLSLTSSIACFEIWAESFGSLLKRERRFRRGF